MNTQEKPYSNKIFVAKVIVHAVLLIILISMSVFSIITSLNAKSTLSYDIVGNVDYKVYLKENNFYKDPYLGKNMTYITSLVDYIDMAFNYNFDITEKSDIEYTYIISANLVITPEDNSKVLFDEKYVILSDTISKKNIDSEGYNISEAIKLDFNYYNDLANKFKSTYGVNCNCKLILDLDVDLKGKDLKYETEFNNSNNMKMTFSLAKKQVDIDTDSASLNISENIDVKPKSIIKNKGFLMLGIVFITASILVVINLIRIINKFRCQKDGYTRYIEKILNNYDRAIVETQYIPNLEEYEVIQISKFNELLDVRDTLRLPIIYSPIEEKSSCFYIKHDDTIYIHYVESTSLVKVKKMDSLFM